MGEVGPGVLETRVPALPGEHGKPGVARVRRLSGSGVYRRPGKVDGVWRDCVIVEKLLGDAAEATLASNASSAAARLSLQTT